MASKTVEALKSINSQLQVAEKGNVVEAVLRQDKKVLRIVVENKQSESEVFGILGFSVTIVNPPVVLSASFDRGVKRLFAKKGDEVFSYVLTPKKQRGFILHLSFVRHFFEDEALKWVSENFKMSREVARWWESELLLS